MSFFSILDHYRGVFVWVVMVMSLALSGCDISVSDTAAREQETALDDGKKKYLSVRFITLRNKTGDSDPDNFYGDERDEVHTGICKVSWTPIKALDTIARNSPLYIPSESLKLDAIDERDTQTFWRAVAADVDVGKPVLYIHGYNIGFEKGCKRAARFAHNLQLGNRLILFSWPSDGDALNYTRDEADVAWSIRYLKETISRMRSSSAAADSTWWGTAWVDGARPWPWRPC